MHPADLSVEAGWPDRLRRFCLLVFAFIPLVLLFSRTGTEAMIAFIALSFLAVVFARRRWAVFAVPVIAVLGLVWIFLMVLNTPFAWWDVNRVLTRTVPWLRFIALFAAAVLWLFRDARDFERVALVWGAILGFCIVDGLVQGFFGTSLSGREVFVGQRLTGPLDRPNIGRFTAFLLYPAVAAFLVAREAWLDRFRGALLALFMTVLIFFVVFTAERGATLLGLATFCLAALVLIVIAPRYRMSGAVMIVLAIAITWATVMASARLQIRIAPTQAAAGDFWNSEYGELIRAAFTVWREQPWVGVGLGNFDRVCDAVEPALAYGCLRHPHNIYLEWLTEAGAIGFAGFLVFVGLVGALVLSTLRRRHDSPLTVALVIACPVLTLFPLVPSQSFFSNWAAMLWWSSLSMTCAAAFHLRYRAGGRG